MCGRALRGKAGLILHTGRSEHLRTSTAGKVKHEGTKNTKGRSEQELNTRFPNPVASEMMNTCDHMDDASLLKAYVDCGDCEAVGMLFRRYADAAFATAMLVCRNRADAEDAVQTAFQRVLGCASKYRADRGAGVRSWLMGIVVNCCRNTIRTEIRRRRREEAAVAGQADTFENAEPFDSPIPLDGRTVEVFEELDRLPEHYKTAIWLRHYAGLSHPGTAEALGLSKKNLSNLVFCGMRELRRRLAVRGITAEIAGLAALLPLLAPERAPATLVEKIGAMAAGSVKPAGFGVLTGAGAWQFVIKAAVTILFTTGAAVLVWKGHEWQNEVATKVIASNTGTDNPAGQVGVNQRFHYKWDFEADGVPDGCKVLQGQVKHVRSAGVDDSGCLESASPVTFIAIDVPLTNLPFVVRWQCSAFDNVNRRAKSWWLPASNVSQFLNIGTNLSSQVTPYKWFAHADYHGSNYIIRTMDGAVQDVTFAEREEKSRLLLSIEPQHRLDNLEVRGLLSDEMPDVSCFERVIAGVPPEKREGRVNVGEFKDYSAQLTNLVVWFIPRVKGFEN